MIRRARHLAVFVLSMASVGLVILLGRFLYLQVLDGDPGQNAAVYQTVVRETQGVRGRLFDRVGGQLAHTQRGVRVRVWSAGLEELGASCDQRRQQLAKKLEEVIGVDADATLKLLRTERYPIVAKEVRDQEAIEELEQAASDYRYRSLRLEPIFHRVYTESRSFAPLLGFVDASGRGVSGLEAVFDARLRPGAGGHFRVHRDGRGHSLRDPRMGEREAVQGLDVRTTLDPVIQAAAERVLDDLLEEVGARWAQAIVIDPQCGDVLSVAQRPAPRNGRPRDAKELEAQYFLAAQEQYTPGSTMKPFMMSLCLREGVISSLDEVVDCENGVLRFGGRRLTDHDGGYGELSIEQILVKSSNIGMAKLLCRLVEGSPPRGSPQYLPIIEYLHGLGFGRPVFGLPREQPGKVTGLESFDRNYSLVSLSFGHEISVTAFQMAQAISLLIGDGTYRPLRFARTGRASLPAVRPTQVLSPDVTRDVRRMMGAVVEEGATRKLRPRGYSMGGKTGTAEKDRDRSKNTMSFFCFAPVEKPVVAVLAVVDEPKKHRFASEVAAPVASKILSEALKSLQVPPDREWEIAEGDGVVGMAGGSR